MTHPEPFTPEFDALSLHDQCMVFHTLFKSGPLHNQNLGAEFYKKFAKWSKRKVEGSSVSSVHDYLKSAAWASMCPSPLPNSVMKKN
jgi:hypothetical protein